MLHSTFFFKCINVACFFVFQNKTAAAYIEASKGRIAQYEKEVGIVSFIHSPISYITYWTKGKNSMLRKLPFLCYYVSLIHTTCLTGNLQF